MTAGAIARENGLVNVYGLQPGQSATVVVKTSRTGYLSGSTITVGSALLSPAPVPTFGELKKSADGFVVPIKNFDKSWNWSASVTAGKVSRTDGTVTVSELLAGQESTLTVVSSRSGYRSSSASITGSPSLGAALVAGFSAVTATGDGFTFTITNHDPGFTWSASAASGKATISGSKVTVTQLAPGQSSVITVSSSRSGFEVGNATIRGTALAAPTSTPNPISNPAQGGAGQIGGGTSSSGSTLSPSPSASPSPTVSPTAQPTSAATSNPSNANSPAPSASPSAKPTATPSSSPTTSTSPKVEPTPTGASSALTVGQPLLTQRKALVSGAKVLVPIVKSPKPDKVVGSTASVAQVLRGKSGVLPNSIYDKKPAKVGSLVIGGIKRAAVSGLPEVNFSAGTAKPIEIQTLAGSATQISIRNFKSRATVKVTVTAPGGNAIAIGKFRADKSGQFKLPPVTIVDAKKALNLRFVSGKTTLKVTLRS